MSNMPPSKMPPSSGDPHEDQAPAGDDVEPYRPPVVGPPIGSEVDEGIVLAELANRPPRLWPTLLVTIAAIGTALVTSGIVLVVAAVMDQGSDVFRNPQLFDRWLESFVGTRAGLATLVLPGQLSFCLVALLAASVSSEPIADRVGLRWGRFPQWTWLAFLLGTPVIGIATSQLLSLVVTEPSDQLKMLERLCEQHAAGSLVVLLMLVSVLPGLVEEILFRGYLQRRLLARLPVLAAIGISTLFFAGAHMDPMHAVGVAPLGIWLGIVAWRADSIWPAIFGHVGNNAYAILISTMIGPDAQPEEVGSWALGLAAIALCAFFTCLAILLGAGRRGYLAPTS